MSIESDSDGENNDMGGNPPAPGPPCAQIKAKHHEDMAKILGIYENTLIPAGIARARNKGKVRSLKELRAWKPTQTRFTAEWPDDGAELSDRWFRLLSLEIIVKVEEFVKINFEFGDIPQEEARSAWLSFSQAFILYTARVARQDNHLGGWDRVLSWNPARASLVTGIIGAVLQEAVFDKLLFGADSTQEIWSNVHDRATTSRKVMRALDELTRSYRKVPS
jgi:hypothetical protein